MKRGVVNTISTGQPLRPVRALATLANCSFCSFISGCDSVDAARHQAVPPDLVHGELGGSTRVVKLKDTPGFI
ncbi:hypothetical protein HYPSUDRAFT_71196 [Hypholoma sublateritium FD-334 SS-4]|uniref:Uncharacterized protein n=1 Tax=Hypholoma sublateritium (strain FD-334 SS-4) TaxID=945553 RepID=A0A0D2P8S8_HYPSF|nr:hypothetical protein HYPSUDRAFT_71196 [Hypholoma sublateritium FD-334 SS-4]